MDNRTLKATVQYEDFIGTVAADQGGYFLEQLAEKYGVDINKYFVIGVEIFRSELGMDELSCNSVNILAVDKQVLGVSDMDSINKYIYDHQGVLPYIKLEVGTYLGEVMNYFKRFDLVLSYKNITASVYQPAQS